MVWYWIVAIVIGIIFAWASTAAVMHNYCGLSDTEASIISIIPFMWIFAIFEIMYQFLKKII